MNPSHDAIAVFGLKKGSLKLNAAGVGTVTRGMVFQRAVELAAIKGSSYHAISKADWKQAREELTGEPEMLSKTVIH